MATLIVMDRTGDSRYTLKPEDALLSEQVDEGGYTAAARSPSGEPTVIRNVIRPPKRPCSIHGVGG